MLQVRIIIQICNRVLIGFVLLSQEISTDYLYSAKSRVLILLDSHSSLTLVPNGNVICHYSTENNLQVCSSPLWGLLFSHYNLWSTIPQKSVHILLLVPVLVILLHKTQNIPRCTVQYTSSVNWCRGSSIYLLICSRFVS